MDYMIFQGSSNCCDLFLPGELNWGLSNFQSGLKHTRGISQAQTGLVGHVLSRQAITHILYLRA